MTATSEGHKDAFLWIDPTTIKVKKNPRGRTNTGFSVDEMARLRGNIKENGHKLPLEIRYIDGVPTLIAGERRWRSIMALVAENDLCFNRVTRKKEPAKQVYATVCCIETACENEAEAMVAAVLENMLHVPLNDYEILLHCQTLDEAGMSRQEQAERLKLSEAWVSQTFSLLNPEKCNPKVLEAMAEGVLGRTQALQFLNYPPDKIEAILDRAIARWKHDEESKQTAAIKERDDLLAQWELNDEKLRQAEDSGDDELAAEARRAMLTVTNQVDDAAKNIEKTKKNKKSKPKPSMEQIQEAAKDEDVEGTAQRHMPMKTLRQYSDKITAMLANPGDEFVNPTTDEPLSRREIQIVRDVCDCILSRNTLRTPLDALYAVPDLAIAAK